MQNCGRKRLRLMWAAKAACVLAMAGLIGWGVWRAKAQGERAVEPFSQWTTWPHPFALTEELRAPAMTNVCERGGAEDRYFDRLKRALIEADEVATEMVCEFHSRAETGALYDIGSPTDRARRRLAAVRASLVAGACPKACAPVEKAAETALREADRFYRVSASESRGFSVRALARAQRAYARLEGELAVFAVRPLADQALISGIVTNDCQALARAAVDWAQAGAPKKKPSGRAAAGAVSIKDEFDQTPEQTFEEAYAVDPYLRGLSLVLDGTGYSPFLAAAFLRWRAAMQAGFFGFSNWSQIPNRAYNEVRYRALARVTAYLRDHPEDELAQAQKVVLSEAPNLRRGGLFGNTCPF